MADISAEVQAARSVVFCRCAWRTSEAHHVPVVALHGALQLFASEMLKGGDRGYRVSPVISDELNIGFDIDGNF
jgi:hypothetical protein